MADTIQPTNSFERKGRLKDLTGLRFGRLFVLDRAPSKRATAAWNTICDCGTVKIVNGAELRDGKTSSCGCLGKFHLGDRTRTHGHCSNHLRSPEYQAYRDILNRCFNPNYYAYHRYGGRGVKLCVRWQCGEDGLSGFACFLQDVGARPSAKHSIDRHPDKDGHYEPTNCRWATKKEQARNRGTNHLVEVFGEKMSLAEAIEKYSSLSYSGVRGRIKRGLSIEDALGIKRNVVSM